MSNTNIVSRPTNTSLLELIQEVEDASGPYSGIIYGPPGTGKTSLAATAPGPVLFDIERGAKVLRNYNDHRRQAGAIPWVNFATFERQCWEVRTGKLGDRYQTVIVDTVSELQKKHVSEIIIREYDRTNGPTFTGSNKRESRYVAWQQDYKESTEAIRRCMMNLRDSPYNLIIVAHKLDDKDADTGALIATRPSITPKLAETIEGMVDFIAYVTSEVTGAPGKQVFSQKAQISPARKVSAKNRIKKLGTLENPTWHDLAVI